MGQAGSRKDAADNFIPSRNDFSTGNETITASGATQNSMLDLKEGEFSAIASAVRSADVFLRNKSLNHLQALASRGSNLSLIRDELLRMDSTDPAFAPLVAALAAVGTPEIQGMLRNVVEQRSGDWRTYSAIVPALGLLTQPVSETVEFLVQQSRLPDPDFSSTAALAIGSIVHTLSKTDPRKGEQLLSFYMAKIESNETPLDDLKESLAVVGNSGLVSAAPLLLKQIDHPRADVRADAIMALRFMRTPQVEDVLISRLFQENDLEVRLRVVDALIHGPVPERILEPVAEALKQRSKTPAVLREKFLELFFHVNLGTEAKRKWAEWLTRYVEAETDPAVRRKVSAALQEILRVP
jgi:HEAT repeat protein